MARLTYEERIKRLEEQRNQLVKPVFVIAESTEAGVKAVTIFSTGKKEAHLFPSQSDFKRYIEQIKNCNIIADNRLLQFRDTEMIEAVSKTPTEDLKAILEGKADARIIDRTLYKHIISKIG